MPTIVAASHTPTLPMLGIGCPSPQGGGRILERDLEGLDNPVEVGIYVGIPESQRAESGSPEDGVSHGVVIALRIFGMLTSVDFDDEAMLEADGFLRCEIFPKFSGAFD